MAEIDWNERYVTGDTPWDVSSPDPSLARFVASGRLPPNSRVIEIGCGTGTNARWLAEEGYDVFALDLSPVAIEKANERLSDDLEARCRFAALDFLDEPVPEGPYDLAFDRGVSPLFERDEPRRRFAARVASLLGPGGLWASIVGSTEGPPREHGPPRRSLRDIVDAVEPELEIVQLERMMFTANIPSPAAGWFVVARARNVPAQPSTRRG